MQNLLEGKTALVLGVANHRSIAWAVARKMAAQGAKLVLTYQNERLEKGVRELGETIPGTLVLPCDLSDDAQIDALAATLKESVGTIHAVAHCVAFAKKEELSGRFIDTSRDGFKLALDISAFTLVAVCRAITPLMTEGGSIVTLTYIGAVRVVPNYNVMGVAKAALEASVRYLASDLGPDGIRVNAISAGPVNTLAARGISGFTGMMKQVAEIAPLRHATEQDEVGDAAMFLCSDLARGITGDILYVDSGYHVMGM